MADRRAEGLYGKFEVHRTDGTDAVGEKHHGCTYFVLDLQHDKHMPAALRAYADSCEAEYPALARDLRTVANDFYPPFGQFSGITAQKPALDLERRSTALRACADPPDVSAKVLSDEIYELSKALRCARDDYRDARDGETAARFDRFADEALDLSKLALRACAEAPKEGCICERNSTNNPACPCHGETSQPFAIHERSLTRPPENPSRFAVVADTAVIAAEATDGVHKVAPLHAEAPATKEGKVMELPDIEVVAAKVHEAWMQTKRAQGITSRPAADGTEQMVPYADLPDALQELDRSTVRAVYAAIEASAK
jgi:hypothetical protein